MHGDIRRRLLIAAGLCLAAFLLLGLLVHLGLTDPLDRAVLAGLRVAGSPGEARMPDLVVRSALLATMLGIWPVRLALAVVVAALLVVRARRAEAAALAVAWIGGALLLPVLKQIAGRARPDLAWRLAEATHNSFPSGHAMGAAILYPMAGFLVGQVAGDRRGGRIGLAVGLVLALLIGLSRVLLGVHWLSDVVAGWAAGAAWTLACLGLSRRPRP